MSSSVWTGWGLPLGPGSGAGWTSYVSVSVPVATTPRSRSQRAAEMSGPARLVGGHPLGVGPETHVAGPDDDDVPRLGPSTPSAAQIASQLGGVDRRALGQAVDAPVAGGVEQDRRG